MAIYSTYYSFSRTLPTYCHKFFFSFFCVKHPLKHCNFTLNSLVTNPSKASYHININAITLTCQSLAVDILCTLKLYYTF